MIRADFHTHSNFSTDSEALVPDMLQAAKEKGLSWLCLTDHIDPDFPNSTEQNPLFTFSPDRYFQALSSLREEKAAPVQLLLGVELGLRPNRPDLNRYMNALVSQYPFDFVLGSLHLVTDADPFEASFWDNITVEHAMKIYFEELYLSIKEYDNFDSLSHFDYITRYIPKELGKKDYSYEIFRTETDRILSLIISREQSLEINTKGFSADFHSFHPKLEVLDRYLELGGKLFTIGSDAHTPVRIASDYKKAEELLLSRKVSKYCIYKNRKPEYVTL